MSPLSCSAIVVLALISGATDPNNAEVAAAIGKPTEGATSPTTESIGEAPTQYCGLHCIYAAAQVLGVEFDFDCIVRPDYLTGRYGSSASDILVALKQIGLTGSYRETMSIRNLRLIDRPVILHVRPVGMASSYRHWVLFLGFDGDSVRIYDPPRDQGKLTAAELLSIWDGVGIIVDEEGASFASSIPISISTVNIVALTGILLLFFRKRVPGVVSLIATTLIVTLTCVAILPTGFYRSPLAVKNVQACFFKNKIHRIEFEELDGLIHTENCQLVDARPSGAF